MRYLCVIAILLTAFETASAATWYVDGSVLISGNGTSWKTAFRTIQKGIDTAVDRDTVIVAEGTYAETIHFGGKSITLTSTEPLSPPVVTKTIIDGKKAGSVVTFLGTEGKKCILSGFTIRNGDADRGGGIRGNGALAAIRNNIITGNSATNSGGGLATCAGTIESNTISENVTAGNGGGLSNCSGTIQNNIIRDNMAPGRYPEGHGGGLFSCGGTIRNNQIIRNTAGSYGGGFYNCDGVIEVNTICGNSAGSPGGGLSHCDGTIQNNIIAANSAARGGALALCDGTIRNNTVTGNSAIDYRGDLHNCEGTIQNCIIWGNTGENQDYGSTSAPTYSCVKGLQPGIGSISTDPRFVDRDGPDNDLATFADNDYRLSLDSPCIDAGDNTGLNPPGLDFDGNLRIAFGKHSLTVDMGVYEYNSGTIEVQEVLPLGSSGLHLMWKSQPNDTYTVWSRTDLRTGSWVEEGSVPSHGAATPWTDTAANGQAKFYRIELK
jgi:hypothetical protein